MKNKLLSIVIPTFNRAEFLDSSLEIHIPILKKYNIEICIFDNASTDNTEQVIKKWMKEYNYLSYHRHEENVGGIINFEYSLKHPETEYIWLIGDTYEIQENMVGYVLDIINNTPTVLDAIVLNLDYKIDIPTKNYSDKNLLLNDLGALMTCAAVSILNKNMINEETLRRYRTVWFTHTAIIFEYIADKGFLIHWAQTESIIGLKNEKLRKTNWSHTPKAFEVGCEDWTNFVMSLPPSYKINNKMKCIMDFGEVSGLFKLKSLLNMRGDDILNYRVYKEYKNLIPLIISYHKFFIMSISVTPKFIPRMIRYFYMLSKKFK